MMPGLRRRACAAATALVAHVVLLPAPASAQPTTTSASPGQDDPAKGDQTATHDGTAPPVVEESKKQAAAVDLSLVYTGELWRNATGGLRRGERYLDNLDVTLTVDADRALGWKGATLFVYGLYNNGRALSGDLVGDAQTVSNIETGVRAARLYEAWVEQRFAGDRVSIKVGLYDLNSEFDTSDVGSLSLLSSHGIGPEFAQSGRNGPSIFPVTSLAIRGDYKLDDRWTLRAAVLDGVPGDPDHPSRTAIKLGHGDGALIVGEAAYARGDTKAAVGYWRYTARFAPILPDDGGATRRGNDGAYLVVERRLTHPGIPTGPEDKRGLAAFVQLGVADGGINPIARYAGGGLVYTGLLRPEGDDRMGMTIARAGFSRPYRRRAVLDGGRADLAEAVLELTYRTPLTKWLTLQPDLQYVRNPSANPTLGNALAIGVRFEVGL